MIIHGNSWRTISNYFIKWTQKLSFASSSKTCLFSGPALYD